MTCRAGSCSRVVAIDTTDVAASCASNRPSLDLIGFNCLIYNFPSFSCIQTVSKISNEQRIQILRTHKLQALARAWTFCGKNTCQETESRTEGVGSSTKKHQAPSLHRISDAREGIQICFACSVLGVTKPSFQKPSKMAGWRSPTCGPSASAPDDRRLIQIQGRFLFWYAKIVAEFAGNAPLTVCKNTPLRSLQIQSLSHVFP